MENLRYLKDHPAAAVISVLIKRIFSHEVIPVGLVVAFYLKRSHIYRSLRRHTIPALVTALAAYRLSTNVNVSLLDYLKQWLSSSRNPKISLILGDICGLFACAGLLHIIESSMSLHFTMDAVFEFIKFLPAVKAEVEKEKLKMETDFETDMKPKTRSIEIPLEKLPLVGRKPEDILSLMRSLTEKEDLVWQDGKVSGAVYHGIKGHRELLNAAFSMYSISNPLHPDIWPSGMKFESEVIAMTASLVNGGDKNVCGCTSSGGTESIILAIKAHRDYFREEYGISAPELISCTSAHAAVDKACDLMNIKLIKVPMDPNTYKIDMKALHRAIGPNTIMMYASAPSYPQGAIDPIEEMGALAERYRIGLHVDCCLGGYVLPFAKMLGYDLPVFDFTVPGVSSMSVDTHKYGYALKGTSVVLYRSRALRSSQYFCYSDWTGGLYTTPTIAGSRSGGLIAQTWASLVALGEEGYKKHVKDIMETTRQMADGVRLISGLKVMGAAEAMIVCFASTEPALNIYSIADQMSKRSHWALSSHQHPACVHLCVTVCHVGMVETFLSDLRACVQEVRTNPDIKKGSAAIYGMTSSLPSGPVNECLKVYNDVVLRV